MKNRSGQDRSGLSGLLGDVGRGSVGSVAAKIISVLLGLLGAIVLARVLGPEQYGVYSWVYALIALIAIPMRVGPAELLVREVAAYQLKGEWGFLRGILLRSTQGVVVVSLVLGGIGATAIYLFRGRLEPVQIATLAWALPLIPLIALADVRGAALRGFRRVVLGQLPEFILRPGLLLVFVATAAVAYQVGAPTAMAIHVLAAALGLVAAVVLLWKLLPAPVKEASPSFEDRRWIASILPLSLIAGMQVVNKQTDLILLGFFVAPEDVGFYQVASKGAALVTLTLLAVNMAIAPHMARLYSGSRIPELQHLLTVTARVIILAALPIAGSFFVFGDTILAFLFGQPYSVAYLPLIILAVGQLFNAAAGSVATLLNMSGHERDTAVGVSVAAVLNVVLNLVLIPPFGTVGAAMATAVTVLTWNTFLCVRAYRRLGLVTTAIRWSR